MSKHTGQCLCGEVKFSVEIEKKEVGSCYCDMCRSWSAGPFIAVHGAHAPVVENPDALGVYDSSEWGQRCFCKTCGSNLFWKAKDESFFGIAFDTLHNAKGFVHSTEIFIDRIPTGYKHSSDMTRMTSDQFWDMVATEQSE